MKKKILRNVFTVIIFLFKNVKPIFVLNELAGCCVLDGLRDTINLRTAIAVTYSSDR